MPARAQPRMRKPSDAYGDWGKLMDEGQKLLDLDPAGFKLSEYDNIRIEMPEKPTLSEEDIDAQLFEYVLSGGKDIQSVADLDDAWVRENFEGLETLDDVRQAMKDQYDAEMEFRCSDIKFRNCCDALLERLEGTVPDEVLEANVDAMRQANNQRLEAMHISFDQFLREESMTPDQYEDKLKAETLYQLRLNVALDLMADVLGMQVGNHEITEYLSTPDPQAFLAEIQEKGQVENARRAAVRVKVMRRIVDTAIVNGEMPGQAEPPATTWDDEPIPNPESMPLPQIRDGQ